jgi:hypothetical protein
VGVWGGELGWGVGWLERKKRIWGRGRGGLGGVYDEGTVLAGGDRRDGEAGRGRWTVWGG